MVGKIQLMLAAFAALAVILSGCAKAAQPADVSGGLANTPVTEDKCAIPSGYTAQEWEEHMSHHPDQYAECLVVPASSK